jgi:hypothetical protein
MVRLPQDREMFELSQGVGNILITHGGENVRITQGVGNILIGRLDLPVHTEGRAARRRRSACDPLCRGLYLAVTLRRLIHRYLGDTEYQRCEGCPGREMKDSGVRSVLLDC